MLSTRQDFHALTCADGTRSIHQIVFVGMADSNGILTAHNRGGSNEIR